MECRVEGAGFGVEGLKFGVQGSGCRVTVIAPVPPTALMSPLFARMVVGAIPLGSVQGSGSRVQGSGFMI